MSKVKVKDYRVGKLLMVLMLAVLLSTMGCAVMSSFMSGAEQQSYDPEALSKPPSPSIITFMSTPKSMKIPEFIPEDIDIEILGEAEERVCVYQILGFITVGDASYEKAVRKILDKTGGDALWNAMYDIEIWLSTYFPSTSAYCMKVRGKAIKFRRR